MYIKYIAYIIAAVSDAHACTCACAHAHSMRCMSVWQRYSCTVGHGMHHMLWINNWIRSCII